MRRVLYQLHTTFLSGIRQRSWLALIVSCAIVWVALVLIGALGIHLLLDQSWDVAFSNAWSITATQDPSSELIESGPRARYVLGAFSLLSMLFFVMVTAGIVVRFQSRRNQTVLLPCVCMRWSPDRTTILCEGRVVSDPDSVMLDLEVQAFFVDTSRGDVHYPCLTQEMPARVVRYYSFEFVPSDNSIAIQHPTMPTPDSYADPRGVFRHGRFKILISFLDGITMERELRSVDVLVDDWRWGEFADARTDADSLLKYRPKAGITTESLMLRGPEAGDVLRIIERRKRAKTR